MKINLLFLMFLTIFISCKGQGNSQIATTKKTEQDNILKAELGKQQACDAIPLNTIASLMDVDKSKINQEDMSFGEKRSICYYSTKEGNRKFFIRMTWKSEKAQGNKVLQNQYATYLSSGENDIKEYQELKNTGDSQILFGIGQDRENKYIHILRKRFENKAEVQLELTKENKDEMAKEQLIELLEELN